MKQLLIDAGNSRLKWAVLEDGRRSPQQAWSYPQQQPVTDALNLIEQLLQTQQAQRLVIVQVLGEAFAQAVTQLCDVYGCALCLAQAQSTADLQLAYANPSQFGADRFVGLLAGRQLARTQAFILIDCGTAVTLDAVEAAGQHRGGVILPGLQLMSEALIQRTQAKHMSAALFEQPSVLATNTLQGMGSGCLLGLVGAVEGLCQRMQAQLASPAMILLCGGDAERLHPWFELEHQCQPDALMIGLQVLAEDK